MVKVARIRCMRRQKTVFFEWSTVANERCTVLVSRQTVFFEWSTAANERCTVLVSRQIKVSNVLANEMATFDESDCVFGRSQLHSKLAILRKVHLFLVISEKNMVLYSYEAAFETTERL